MADKNSAQTNKPADTTKIMLGREPTLSHAAT